jgi:hypothetical protein
MVKIDTYLPSTQVVCELRVRSVSLARPVAFDHWSTESTIEIGWPRLNPRGHVDGAGRPDTVQHVRSPRNLPSKGANGYIRLWGYKYLWWLALAGAWHPWDLVSILWEC